MGINVKRILLVTSLNYLIKRTLREIDYFLTQRDYIRYYVVYSCRDCQRSFSIGYAVEIECPHCCSKDLEEREPEQRVELTVNKEDNNCITLI